MKLEMECGPKTCYLSSEKPNGPGLQRKYTQTLSAAWESSDSLSQPGSQDNS